MNSQLNNVRLGFIGAGRMATALAKGFLSAGLTKPEHMLASDPLPMASQEFARVTGSRTVSDNRQVAAESNVIFLAVKPQQMADVLAALQSAVSKDHLVISIAAGIPLRTIQQGLGAGPRLVRVMPNTPCLVGQGASAYCRGPGATPEDGVMVGQLLEAVGRAVEVPEKLLDAVTGLSGSGPAFVYVMIEALSDGGVNVGLPRDIATTLAAQTVLGAAQMVLETKQHPGLLKDQVASPGGTTIAGLQALEEHGLRAALIAAVEAATNRSIELGS